MDNAAYASSKAAVAALARNLAAELGPYGIRVNYFNADFVDTPLMRRLVEQRAASKGVSTEAQTEEYRSRNVLGVGPIPADAVAEAALFLASPRSALHDRRRAHHRRRNQGSDAPVRSRLAPGQWSRKEDDGPDWPRSGYIYKGCTGAAHLASVGRQTLEL